MTRNLLRLIEPALPLARGMKRNRDDQVESAFAKSFIIQRGDEPTRDQVTKVNLPAVLEIQDNLANDPALAIT